MRKVFLEDLPLQEYRNGGILWDNLIGHKIRFVYDDIVGEIILKKYIDKKKHKLLISYKNIDFVVYTDTILKCRLGNVINNIYAIDEKKALISCIIDDYKKIKDLTVSSEKYVNVKCPYCNTIRKIQVKQLFRSGTISCRKCGDGRSYPEKVFYSFLEQLNVKFECEKRLGTEQSVRYDFFLSEYNTIVEIDGIQHFKKENNWYLGNDQYKTDLAKKNGLVLIRIDASYSDIDYIKKSIEESKLKQLFDLSKVDWNKCNLYAYKSLVYEIGYNFNQGIKDLDKLALIFHLNKSTVRSYLKKASELGFCDFSISELNKQRYKKAKIMLRERCNKKISVYKNGILFGEFESVVCLCEQSMSIFGVQFNASHVGSVANHKYGRKTHHGFTFEWL